MIMPKKNFFYYSDIKDDGQNILVSINTTPLIDVLLVLIIMIIITMPIQLQKLEISYNYSPTYDAKEKKTVLLQVKSDGSIGFDGTFSGVKRMEIHAFLKRIFQADPNTILRITVTTGTIYSRAIRVFNEAHLIGFRSVELLTERRG
jgi:biopolymer transport protein ExbD